MRVVRLLIAVLALLVGAVAVGLLFMIAGLPRTPFGWVWAALAFLVGFAIARTTLSMGLNASTAFEQGAQEAAEQRRGDAFEATGRRAGAVVGKGLGKVARIGAPKPSAQPAPGPTSGSSGTGSAGTESAPSDTSAAPKPEVTVDSAARVIGSMIGRRSAERRNRP